MNAACNGKPEQAFRPAASDQKLIPTTNPSLSGTAYPSFISGQFGTYWQTPPTVLRSFTAFIVARCRVQPLLTIALLAALLDTNIHAEWISPHSQEAGRCLRHVTDIKPQRNAHNAPSHAGLASRCSSAAGLPGTNPAIYEHEYGLRRCRISHPGHGGPPPTSKTA